MRVAANHKQALETSLSTCTEPWINGFPFKRNSEPARALKTWANPRRIGCPDRFPDQSGQTLLGLIKPKETSFDAIGGA